MNQAGRKDPDIALHNQPDKGFKPGSQAPKGAASLSRGGLDTGQGEDVTEA